MEALKVAHESLVVLYEAKTGDIVHTHRVVTFQGGEHPEKATLERQALEQLRLAQPQFTKKPEFLHAAPTSMRGDTIYKVDPQKKVLIEIPSPPGAEESDRRQADAHHLV
jgi:hypothetical protein